ncbi:MAG: restriction endonuclease subunit S [Coriobacteriia bacterium]|nr:restriction endonuclease subunit S [Coriobacteriia bacterium]
MQLTPSIRVSNEPWLVSAPADWPLLPLRKAGSFLSGGTPDTTRLDYWDGDIPWVSSQDVRGSVLHETSRTITPEGLGASSARMAPAGALVFVMRSGILRHTLPVSRLATDSAVNQDIKALLPGVGAPWDMRYIVYFIQGWQSDLLKAWRDQGATVESIKFDAMLRALLPVPPIELQKTIADYLDAETARVDELVAEK